MSSNLDDLRSSFEYNDEDEENEPVEEEYYDDDEALDDEEYEEEEEPRRRSPLRLILLLLLVLALSCVACFFLLPRLPFDIPGLSSPSAPVVDDPATQPTTQPTDETAPPADVVATEEPLAGTVEPGEEDVDAAGDPLPPPSTTEPLPPADATTDPSIDDPLVPPTDGTTEPPADGTTEPPTDDSIEAPADGTTEPPVEGTSEPPLDGTAEPPTDDATEPPTDDTTEPPTDDTTEDPGEQPTDQPVASCDANIPPVADANGPYNAMQGKGQAVVVFDGSASSDTDGDIVTYEWDFGDGSPVENGASVTHGYQAAGTYQVKLIVTDNCGATGQDTTDVTIVGPTPPSQQEDNSSEEADEEASQQNSDAVAAAIQSASDVGTLGFCYRVQSGDTLIGISQQFEAPMPDLAFANSVSTEYYVIEGQGIFVPTGQVKEGPNVYIAQPYDTLDVIAFNCGLAPSFLAEVNELSLDASLAPDQAVIIPPWSY